MWMKKALHIAQQGQQTCSPNPMVGCVIIKNNILVGQGFHERAGGPHAEIVALTQAGDKARGSEVYVTLEPCSHQGRTPPCVNALIQANVRTAHVAVVDPNPLVSGRGIEKLREAGITVHVGQCQEEAYQLNRVFFHYITQQRPFVIAKWAMTLDGKIATSLGLSKWITSQAAREHAHNLRSQVDAILVGANTLRYDDPQLTARLAVTDQTIARRQPRPIIVTASGDIPLNSHLLQAGRRTLIITSDRMSQHVAEELRSRHMDCLVLPLVKNQFSPDDILKSLGSLGLSQILVEGGSQLLTSFFRAECVNDVYAYLAPKIMGGSQSLTPIMGDNPTHMDQFYDLHGQQTIPLDPDICFMASTGQTPRSYEEFQQRERS